MRDLKKQMKSEYSFIFEQLKKGGKREYYKINWNTLFLQNIFQLKVASILKATIVLS